MRVPGLRQVLLYNEGTAETLDVERVAEYLRGKLGKLEVRVMGNPFTPYPEKSRDYAARLASLKIQDARRKIVPEVESPLYGEIEYERRKLLGKTRAFGVLYDGFHLQRVFAGLIGGGKSAFEVVPIVFTNRLFATWDDVDLRYHVRTSVYGLASIISSTGLVEAPARPREYYLLKQQYEMLGKDLLELKERFKGTFIDYEDERLSEVMKGYAMQAVFYSLTGDAFCDDKGCRLYNAHWQSELIFAQLESEYEFCQRHASLLEKGLY